nr:MAG TPA: hypothetical protein [Caudoviricetes sp.]
MVCVRGEGRWCSLSTVTLSCVVACVLVWCVMVVHVMSWCVDCGMAGGSSLVLSCLVLSSSSSSFSLCWCSG